MEVAAEALMAQPPYKRAAAIEAAAGPQPSPVGIRGTSGVMMEVSVVQTALGGRLFEALVELEPDVDLWAADGPLGLMTRFMPDNPAHLAAATDGWRDPAAVAWACERAPDARAVAGLADTPLAAALYGPETGLALVDLQGRLGVVADRDAPIASFTLLQIAEVVDRAFRDADACARGTRPARRSVAAAAVSRGSATVFAALACAEASSAAAIGTRFAWQVGLLASAATESRPRPGAIAQLLLLAAVSGAPLLLARTRRTSSADAELARLVTARACIAVRDLPCAGALECDEGRLLIAVRAAWAAATPDAWRAPSPHGGPARRVRPDTPAASPARPLSRASAGDTRKVEFAGEGPRRARPSAAAAGTDTEGSPARPARRAAAPREAAAADSSGGEASPPRARERPSRSPGRTAGAIGTPRPPAGEERDAAGKLRCYLFAHTGDCPEDPCKYSHRPPDRRGPTAAAAVARAAPAPAAAARAAPAPAAAPAAPPTRS